MDKTDIFKNYSSNAIFFGHTHELAFGQAQGGKKSLVNLGPLGTGKQGIGSFLECRVDGNNLVIVPHFITFSLDKIRADLKKFKVPAYDTLVDIFY